MSDVPHPFQKMSEIVLLKWNASYYVVWKITALISPTIYTLSG